MVIGKIIEVRGIKAKAEFYKQMPPHIINNGDIFPAPQINSYIKTNVGLDTVICQICGEYYEFNINEAKKYIVELEIRGRITKCKFLSGLRLMPIVGANIETLSEEEFNSIFSEPDYSIPIGKNLYDPSNKIHLDINKLIPSHIGIFGNTGSGKSNTLAKILKEYINYIDKYNYKNSKILIFDLNNEYGENSITNEENKNIFKLTTRKDMDFDKKIPFNYELLSYEDLGVILNATEKTQLPVIKKAFEKSKDTIEENEEHYGVKAIKNILANNDNNKFFILRRYINDYVTGIDMIKYHTTQRKFYYDQPTAGNFIDGIENVRPIIFNIPTDWLDRFELELIIQVALQSESGINFEYISPLMARMENRKKDFKKIFRQDNNSIYKNFFQHKNITVIQLGTVNKDTKEIVPSLLSNILYKEKKEEKDDMKIKSIINIVIDEAHNLLSKDEEETELHNNTLNVFEEIIKEGRKFGVYLMLSSQRPSDISNTITSQLHNYFIHKLVNPNDIEKIRKTVSFMSDSTLNMLTMLGQGECIISGTALYMPQYVSVDELDNDSKPNSNDVILLGNKGILKTNVEVTTDTDIF